LPGQLPLPVLPRQSAARNSFEFSIILSLCPRTFCSLRCQDNYRYQFFHDNARAVGPSTAVIMYHSERLSQQRKEGIQMFPSRHVVTRFPFIDIWVLRHVTMWKVVYQHTPARSPLPLPTHPLICLVRCFHPVTRSYAFRSSTLSWTRARVL
jgi:hypothetical protein